MPRPHLFLILLMFAASGCSVLSITANSVGSKVAPSLALQNYAAPHKSVLIHGFLERTPADLQHNVFVVASTSQGQVVTTVSVGRSGMYSLFVPPGEFLISAFVDRNHDREIEASEMAGQTQRPITVLEAETRAHIGVDVFFVDPLHQTLKFVAVVDEDEDDTDGDDDQDDDQDDDIPSIEPASDLFAPRFGDKNIRLGSDKSTTAFFNSVVPLQYLDEIDLTDGRTPIIFVHGINDSPRIFDRFDASLPAGTYEAFYYYYPTGARLSYAAQLLHHLFFSGKVLPTSRQVVLAAHSMGGLVARGSLNELKGRGGESQVKLYASFATPYGGVNAANFATTSSPAIVPSWIDVASRSDYIRELFQPLPAGTIFELCAANQFGNGDGVIPLESQKAPRAVAQARSITEFPDTHVGITEDPAAIRQLLAWASELAAPADHNQVLRQEEVDEGRKTAIGNLEKRRRAELLLNAILREAELNHLETRISLISPTLFRVKLSGPNATAVLQANAGEGIRFDIPEEPVPLLLRAWPKDAQGLEQIVFDVMNETAKRLISSNSAGRQAPSEMAPAAFNSSAAAPQAVRKTPPFSLGSGLSLNLDPGEQHFTVVTPFFMDMYVGTWGLGVDVRLTAFAPIEQTPTANIEYQPFYLLTGPRIRLGGADSLFIGKFALNAGLEIGRMTLTVPGEPERFPSAEELIRHDGITRFIATTSLTLGVRIRPDFYAITQAEAGARPSPVDVDVAATDPYHLSGQVFGNIRLGIEVHVP